MNEQARKALETRVALINGNFDLPKETPASMSKIREILEKAATELKEVFEKADHCDVGRAIATMDLLQQAKDTACVSLILPHHK